MRKRGSRKDPLQLLLPSLTVLYRLHCLVATAVDLVQLLLYPFLQVEKYFDHLQLLLVLLSLQLSWQPSLL